MKLKSVEIRGLWGKRDLKWFLDSRVNILTGSNGAGKSTIMDIIALIISVLKLPQDYVSKVRQVNIELDNNQTLVCVSFNDTLQQLRKEAEQNDAFRDLWEDVSASIPRSRRSNHMGITASVCYLVKNRKIVPISGNRIKGLKVDIVSTFDSSLPSDMDSSKYNTLKEQGVRSTLDIELHDLQERYAYYLGGLATRLEQYLKEGNVVNKEYVETLYSQKNLFIDIVDELFAESGKRINIENSRLEFIIEEDKRHISMYELSSGEKQLLYILMTVLMEEQEEYILFMDEPEISLHVDWQECLIEKILLLNPNCQLLIATHAPSLLLGGWHNYVKNIADIKI